MSSSSGKRRFARIDRLPPYVFNITAELKLAALLPAEVVDRTKGYFPVPGIRHMHGEVMEMVRAALTNDAARSRGLYRPETLDRLLAAPNDARTTLGSNALWQLAVLEMWLQSMEVR